MKLYDIDMMVKLLEECSKVFKNLNGDSITSLNKIECLSLKIDEMLNKIERKENDSSIYQINNK